MAGSEIRDILSSDRNCQKLSEAARNFRNLKKVDDFVVFPGIDGFRSFFPILLETARNRQELPGSPKSDRFCGISWYRWISIDFSNHDRNCKKLP